MFSKKSYLVPALLVWEATGVVASRASPLLRAGKVENTDQSSSERSMQAIPTRLDGTTLSQLQWGVPTSPLSLPSDTLVEWTMLLPAYTKTRCTLKAAEGETGDVDLAFYNSPSNMICASRNEYSDEECSYWGNADALEITIGLAAFDDVDNLVLTCTNELLPQITFSQQSKTISIPAPGSNAFYIDVSNVDQDINVTCSYSFHFFGGAVEGTGDLSWYTGIYNGETFHYLGGNETSLPSFPISSDATGAFLVLAMVSPVARRKVSVLCETNAALSIPASTFPATTTLPPVVTSQLTDLTLAIPANSTSGQDKNVPSETPATTSTATGTYGQDGVVSSSFVIQLNAENAVTKEQEGGDSSQATPSPTNPSTESSTWRTMPPEGDTNGKPAYLDYPGYYESMLDKTTKNP